MSNPFKKIRSMVEDSMSKNDSKETEDSGIRISQIDCSLPHGSDEEAYIKAITEPGPNGEKPFDSVECAIEVFRIGYLAILLDNDPKHRTTHFKLNRNEHRDVLCLISRDSNIAHGFGAREGINAVDKMIAPKS